MKEKVVHAVMGDIAPARESLPAMQILERKYGAKIKWFVDASPNAKAGTDVLAKANIAYETRWPVPTDNPDIIIYGTSGTATDAQMMWTAFGKLRHIKVIGIEDLWGTGEMKHVQWLSPDLMLVIDEVAAKIAKNVYPRLDVKVVGKPTFEGFSDLVDRASVIRKAVRQKLDLSDSDFLVVVLLGGDDRVWFQFREIIKKASDFNGITFAWRIHPKEPEKDKLWEEAIASGIKSVDARSVSMDELILASNAILGNWDNNDPYWALVAGIPVITMLFPDRKEDMIARGCPEGIPPILIPDIHWGAKSVEELIVLLQEVKQNEEAVREYTRVVRAKPFLPLFNQGAAERIAAEIAKYL